MPWLPMYLVDKDVGQLCRLLDEDPDVALIRPDEPGRGPGRWKADGRVPKLSDGEYGLWHVPSGPIKLEPRDVKAKARTVKDPFAGWREIDKPVERGVPWLGPGPTGVVWLSIRRKAGTARESFSPMTGRSWSAPANEVIGLSSFNWIGNYYAVIGSRPAASTERWWKALRRAVAKLADPIPTSGPITGRPKDVWAFPAALAQIRQGRRRADNPT